VKGRTGRALAAARRPLRVLSRRLVAPRGVDWRRPDDRLSRPAMRSAVHPRRMPCDRLIPAAPGPVARAVHMMGSRLALCIGIAAIASRGVRAVNGLTASFAEGSVRGPASRSPGEG
jgi:hypothetical protein